MKESNKMSNWIGTIDPNVTEMSLYSSSRSKCDENCWIYQGKCSILSIIARHCLQCKAIKKSPYIKEIKKALKSHGLKITNWIK